MQLETHCGVYLRVNTDTVELVYREVEKYPFVCATVLSRTLLEEPKLWLLNTKPVSCSLSWALQATRHLCAAQPTAVIALRHVF